jgi:hypothetical protein
MWVRKLMRNKQQRKQAPFIDKSGHLRRGGHSVSEKVRREHDGTIIMRMEGVKSGDDIILNRKL